MRTDFFGHLGSPMRNMARCASGNSAHLARKSRKSWAQKQDALSTISIAHLALVFDRCVGAVLDPPYAVCQRKITPSAFLLQPFSDGSALFRFTLRLTHPALLATNS